MRRIMVFNVQYELLECVKSLMLGWLLWKIACWRCVVQKDYYRDTIPAGVARRNHLLKSYEKTREKRKVAIENEFNGTWCQKYVFFAKVGYLQHNGSWSPFLQRSSLNLGIHCNDFCNIPFTIIETILSTLKRSF